MSEKSTSERLNQSASSAADFHASPSHAQGDDVVMQILGGCGLSSHEPFAKLDPDGVWLKTYQGSCLPTMEDSLLAYSETWPNCGIAHNGFAYQLKEWAPLTEGGGCSSLPTPSATNYGSNVGGAAGRVGKERPSLETMAKKNLWPIARDSRTPKGAAQMPNRHGGEPLVVEIGGPLNPTWVEWLMGFPEGWTDLNA